MSEIDLRAALAKMAEGEDDELFPRSKDVIESGMEMANAAKRLLIEMAESSFSGKDKNADKSMAYMVAILCLFRQAEIAAGKKPGSAPHRAWGLLSDIITKEAVAASLEGDDDSVA